MSDDKVLVVLQLGSVHVRSGLSGDDAPRKEFLNLMDPHTSSQRNPVVNGVIDSADDFEVLVKAALGDGFDATVDSTGIFICDLPKHTAADRKRFAAVLFEKFCFPAVLFYSRPALCALSAGRTHAIVVEMGDATTCVVPVVNCVAVKNRMVFGPVAGAQLTEKLRGALRTSCGLDGKLCQRDLRTLKSQCRTAATAEAFDDATAAAKGTDAAEVFTLWQPTTCNGVTASELRLPPTLSSVPEALFRPALFHDATESTPEDSSQKSLAAIIAEVISTLPGDQQEHMFANIVVSGRGSRFPDLEKRLQYEVQLLAPKGTSVEVVADDARSVGAWVGGSILSSMRTTAENNFVTLEHWKAYGPAIFDSWSTD